MRKSSLVVYNDQKNGIFKHKQDVRGNKDGDVQGVAESVFGMVQLH